MADAPFTTPTLHIDPVERLVSLGGRPVRVLGRAFDLLRVLAAQPGKAVSKTMLLDAVWGDTVVEEANLHVHVSALRKALGADAIATLPGRGYRLSLPITLGDHAEPQSTEPATRDLAPPPLLGRARELAALAALLAQHRLVTITGSGGVGKTRLALAALWAVRAQHSERVVVDLASLTDPQWIAVAVGTALKLSAGAGGAALPALLAAAQSLKALVLLDNAEHLIDGVAAVAQALLTAAPGLRLIVTSQVPLRVGDECVFRLDGLDLPPPDATLNASEARAFGAVALFHERLQAADRRLGVDDDNLALVLSICRRLDGIALALELAAARCPLLGLRGVAERLDDRLRLLRFDSRSASARQQTLGAAMAFSVGLLSAAQQCAFQQLAVFVGTFPLNLALPLIEVDGLDELDRIDLLGELVDRSLVSVDAAEPPRYRLLESGRLYGLSQLNDVDEAAARQRHALALRTHFDAAWAASWVLPEETFVARFEPDLDNLRAALDEALLRDPQTAIALAGAATRLWRRLSLHPEAIRYCEAACALINSATPPAVEARLWEGLAQVFSEVSHAASRPAAQRAAALYASLNDARGRYLALAHIAFSYCGHDGVAAEAQAAYDEMQRLEDPDWPPSLRLYGRKVESGIASDDGQLDASRRATQARLALASACGSARDVNAALGNLADLALMAGDAAEAVRLGRDLLARLRPRDAATRAIALSNLVHALLAQGDDAGARHSAEAMVAVLSQMDFCFQVYFADALALLAAREARWQAAATLLGHGQAQYAAQQQTREMNEQRAHQAAVEAVAAHCTPAQIEAWHHEGLALNARTACVIALERA